MNKINTPRSLISRVTTVIAAGSLAAATFGFAPQAAANNTEDLHLKIRQMEQSLRMMREELDTVRSEASQPAQRVDSLEERVTLVELSDDYMKKGQQMIFFRGGYARMNDSRRNQVFSDFFADDNGLASVNNLKDGWYIGAGIEHTLSEDLFGLWDGAELFGEINFQYVEWSSRDSRDPGFPVAPAGVNTDSALRVVPAAAGLLGFNPGFGGTNPRFQGNAYGISLSQFTLSASPKIKFLPDSSVRPWIIPVGLDINVISPPSDGGTYISAGINFGGGVEWNFWKNMVVGTDVRYHWSPNIEGVDPRYWQAGGYLGFQF